MTADNNYHSLVGYNLKKSKVRRDLMDRGHSKYRLMQEAYLLQKGSDSAVHHLKIFPS